MTTVLSPSPFLQFLDPNGLPAARYKLFTYSAGTTTKIVTYVDSTGVGQNTNPIILDGYGQANVWLQPNTGYKYVLAFPTDTDPPANPIKTIDNIIQSQLITLYGGVDTGIVNAYILTFTANFSGYTDGIVIYWIPANTNTGPSTINVNGLGVVSIVNANGSALTTGQLVANQPVLMMYKGGKFLLLIPVGPTVTSGSFSMTCISDAGIPAMTVYYSQIGNSVTLYSNGTNGTSTSSNFLFSGLPAALTPARAQLSGMRFEQAVDNGTSCAATMNISIASTIAFNKYAGGSDLVTSWTSSGSKFTPSFNLTYLLN